MVSSLPLVHQVMLLIQVVQLTLTGHVVQFFLVIELLQLVSYLPVLELLVSVGLELILYKDLLHPSHVIELSLLKTSSYTLVFKLTSLTHLRLLHLLSFKLFASSIEVAGMTSSERKSPYGDHAWAMSYCNSHLLLSVG
tara:strand:- start:1574 stop:1990 length:417 start_codon:yes stop_codon:yes gene_type:complete